MSVALNANCFNPFFQMQCDVYYATETQDQYGAIVKRWQWQDTVPCVFYPPNNDSNNTNFQFDDKKFYRLESILSGRMPMDVRKSSDGQYHPLTHILITNIRGLDCNEDESYYIETNGGYDGTPIIFEVKMVQPFIGPFGKTEYFKMQLERTDAQELTK